MKLTLSLLTCTTLLLSGCASVYQYKNEGASATLNVPKFDTEYRLLGGFSGGMVMISPEKTKNCGEFTVISKDKVGEKDINVNIPANKDLFVHVSRYNGNASCAVVGVFSPQADKSYKVLFNMQSYNMSKHRCNSGVVEVTKDGQFKPVVLKRAFASTWDGIKVCKSKAQL